MSDLEQRLAALTPDVLRGLLRGIEKESLRVRPDGMLASTPHPAALGSPLTHPNITTDFSEAQVELITDVHASVEACRDELTRIHQFVYQHLGDEMLWCGSMPCGLPADDDIPIGRFGESNVGRAKSIYRIGLGHRYGRRMQTISGIHYNFSLPAEAWPTLAGLASSAATLRDFQDITYFGLIRNFRRNSWLLLYLFGASPAVCASFVADRAHDLEVLRSETLFRPGATSLRMGPLGYQSDAQAALAVSYNSLTSYGASLQEALTRPYPLYEAIGLRAPPGDTSPTHHEGYRQLATSLLQIENEFYGTIRPKRRIRPGERPLHALRERGVEYVEVRCMDLDPFCAIGIEAATMRFLDIFLLHCLLADSGPDTPAEIGAIARNQHRVARRGRDKGVTLLRDGCEVPLGNWGNEVLRECAPIACALDAAHGGRAYGDALTAAAAALDDAQLTPSARILDEMRRGYDGSYIKFILAQSRTHRDALRARPLDAPSTTRLLELAQTSVLEQKVIEAGDDLPFETYRQRYLSQDKLGVAG